MHRLGSRQPTYMSVTSADMAGRLVREPDQNSMTSRRPHLPTVAKAKETASSLLAIAVVKMYIAVSQGRNKVFSLCVLFAVTGGRCGRFLVRLYSMEI